MDGLYGPVVEGAIQFRLNCIRDSARAASKGNIIVDDCETLEEVLEVIADFADEVYNLFLGLNEDGSFVKE